MRGTEARVLNTVAGGAAPSPAQVGQLLGKIGKSQSRSRAREITDATEAESTVAFSQLSAAQQDNAKQSVKDYSNDSTAINTACRTGAAHPAIARLDAMFLANTQHGNDNVQRVTYRLLTYGAGQVIPYGAAGAPSINVGDLISDAGYVSASENRQLLVNGVENPKPGSRYVKICIIGAGGVNIAGQSVYSNANEAAVYKMNNPKLSKIMTAHAGQAEILYPRGSIFRVEKIGNSGSDVHVVLSRPNGVVNGVVKNSFTGL